MKLTRPRLKILIERLERNKMDCFNEQAREAYNKAILIIKDTFEIEEGDI